MLLAQHRDAANATSTTSGDANPAYDTTMTSPPTTAPAGATLLAPNATTLADPTTPWASPEGCWLPAPMPLALLGARSVPAATGVTATSLPGPPGTSPPPGENTRRVTVVRRRPRG